jgi:hypothetical protein
MFSQAPALLSNIGLDGKYCQGQTLIYFLTTSLKREKKSLLSTIAIFVGVGWEG